MKRSLAVLLALGLVFGALFGTSADAAKKKKKKKKPKKVERVVEYSYDAPAVGVSPPGTGVCFGATNTCGNIAVGLKEKWVKVEIDDMTGLPVAFTLSQDTDPDTPQADVTIGRFCGSTGDETLEIEPGYELIVFPWAIGADCGAVATQGTVTATLSNRP